MKKFLLAAYIFFFTGGCIAQQRENKVVAEIDFNKPTIVLSADLNAIQSDTIKATLQLSRGLIRYKKIGYAVINKVVVKAVLNDDVTATRIVSDTTYLDDRKRLIKPPITVWGMKEKEGKP
jgi:hypothetical protein